jgi:CPA2 family monovalent cation:H+ antiporter-2
LFVSVARLFDPDIIIAAPMAVAAAVPVIVLIRSLAAPAIGRAFRHARETGPAISASLAQIGAFSFILIVLGVNLGIVPDADSAACASDERGRACLGRRTLIRG